MRSKVFGIGLHKTGTSTLGKCLEILGYHVCPEEIAYATLEDVAAQDHGTCLELAENYDGFQDSPWNCDGVYRVLHAAFPGAKFVLTTRDEDRWFRSYLRWVTLHGSSEAPAVHSALGRALTADTKEESTRAFREHNVNVIEHFGGSPSLLVVDWEAGDGWEQLCDFLGKPIPDVPFPHLLKGGPAIRCSIVMATRNKADALAVTLESIRAQTVPFPLEVIVVDDGSTDNTAEVCRRHGVQYYYLKNPRYRNPSKARNVGYRAARGDVILAQSDEVVHVTPQAIEFLTCNLRPGEVLLAEVDNYRYRDGKPVKFLQQYCGSARQVPFFFLGAVWREDLYAIGGNDEEFVEPCYDDNWFADCLIKGLGLRVRYTGQVNAHHQSHDCETGGHAREDVSRKLYAAKVAEAEHTGRYCSSGGPWPEKPGLTSEGNMPKRMSFFWAGPRLSWMRYMTIRTFRHFNPDWRIVLHRMEGVVGEKTWGSGEMQDSQSGADHTDKIADLDVEVRRWKAPLPGLAPAHASDLYGWDQLCDEGGMIADMDILFVRPMPYAFIRDADAVFCLTAGYMAVGLLGASAGCQLFADIAQEALAGYRANGYESAGADALYRLAHVRRSEDMPGMKCLIHFRRDYPDVCIRELPPQTVYPYNYTQTARIFSRTDSVSAQCVGIHWFGGDRLSQKWNDRLTHANYREYRNTYTRYAAKVAGNALDNG